MASVTPGRSRALMATSQPKVRIYRFIRPDAWPGPCLETAAARILRPNHVQGRLNILVSISLLLVIAAASALLVWVHRRVRAALHAAEQQAAMLAQHAELLDLAHDAILVWDLRSGAIQFWNRGAEELYGWKRDEVLGRTPQAVLDTRFPVQLSEIDAELVRCGRWEGELVHKRRDGTPVVVASRWALKFDASRTPSAVIGINSDITSRKQAEAALEHQALHDALTGLPNRSLFRDRLERAVAHADRHEQLVAVLFLDLDNFKVVNDSLGHQAGDALLVEIAARLKGCVRTGDTVARLGGDEFTVLLEELNSEAEAEQVAIRISEALQSPLTIGERDVFISASIGLALSAGRRTHTDSLLRNADIAMYRSKAAGKARHSIFDSGMKQVALECLELEMDLRQALALGQFRVHYQPIYALADGRLSEVEALLRWERPGHGLVSPGSFIPVAEETGLIVPIGRWVLQQACEQAAAWQTEFSSEPPLVVCVNLSARQLQDPGLLVDIERILRATRLDPRALKLEITESVALQGIDAAVEKLQALKAAGINVAIDDFGTGYLSLGYLKRLPVDTLKIDRSFVEGLGDDVQDAAIVHSVVALARTLRLNVVGEGVETQAQAAQLQALGCDSAQGFLFARPEPAEHITGLLREHADRELARAA
jgi:diguanylate cyclase (GGDEF)-like protein/PAS domain S-box-containing protein